MIGGSDDFRALAFVLVGLIGAAIFRPRLEDDQVSMRVLIYWMVAACIIFIVARVEARFPLLAIAALACMPKRLEDQGAYYLGVLPAIPAGIIWYVPFPGIAYLVKLDHSIVLALTVLIAMAIGLSRRRDVVRVRTPWLDFFAVGVFLTTAVLSARGLQATPTNAARFLVVTALTVLLPYFVLSRTLASRAALQSLTRVVLTMGGALVALGTLAFLVNWDFYGAALEGTRFSGAAYRSGTVRVGLTMVPVLTGLLIGLFLIVLWHHRRIVKNPKIIVFGWLAAGLFVLALTQSRGGYVAAFALLAGVVFVRARSPALRILMVVTALGAMFVTYRSLSATGFAEVDQYGTFAYRNDVLRVSLAQIRDQPLFGNNEFYRRARFEELVQGGGIIDIVNTYLQYALKFGLVGLGCFVALLARAGFRALDGADRARKAGHEDLAAIGTTMVATLGAYAIMIFTTSAVSYVEPLCFVLVGACAGYSAVVRAPNALAVTGAAAPAAAARWGKAVSAIKVPSKLPGNAPTSPRGGRVSAPATEDFDVRPGPRGWPS